MTRVTLRIHHLTMPYRIFGRDRQTGDPVEPFLLDAPDETTARDRAAEDGILVDDVEEAAGAVERARNEAAEASSASSSDAEIECVECGYELSHVEGQHCPECGTRR